MNALGSIYKNGELIEHFLLLSIGFLIVSSVLFLILLFISRIKKIVDAKLISGYNPIIDKILFPLLFNNASVHTIIESTNYQRHSTNKKFRKTLLANIIKLHINYSGANNLNLLKFYRESGLIKISFDKLQSNSWSRKCEGIRELSQMNVQEAYPDIHKLIWRKNSTLRLEALLGIIKLKGLEGLTILNDYTEPINDWIQLNILYEINNSDRTTVKNFSDFLKSKNESLVILGLRLIAHFNQVENIDQVREIQISGCSEKVKNSAAKTFSKLSSLNGNTGELILDKSNKEEPAINQQHKKLNVKKHVAFTIAMLLLFSLVWIPLKTNLLKNSNDTQTVSSVATITNINGTLSEKIKGQALEALAFIRKEAIADVWVINKQIKQPTLLTIYFNNSVTIFYILFLLFAVLIMSSYVILAVISVSGLSDYLKENAFINYKVMLASDLAPSLSVIAPAYNEGKTIEENVQSLLSLNYNNYEVIVVNDGSKDNSLEILIKSYNLEEIKFDYKEQIKTKQIKAVYKSKNPAHNKLIVVDKYNGGKADALNVGINISSNPYIVCIDVDCILDKDALLILTKPYLERSDVRVIATGGVVRIANSCIIERGHLIEIKVPDKLLPRIQALEYLRAFLLGRMAWSKLDGLLIISGAFGMFDKEIAIQVGGYNCKTVGEDMELIVRMRRYMIETKQKYAVPYIPNPLCWTEAPETFNILLKQRSRWTRGTMETLWIHRKMFLNPKYKVLGLLSIPYWFLFEYLAPIIELIGLLATFLFAILGILNWKLFILLLLFAYCFAVMISFFALLMEEYTYHQYPKIADFNKLLSGAIIEPFYFHLFVVYAALKGNWEKIKGNKGWGDMTRTGFDKKIN